jgi:GNAT superfamily N-acetyltransferase
MNAPAISYRPARLSDAEAVAALAQQLGYDADSAAVAARLARLLPRSDQEFHVAEHDGRAVGWIHMLLMEFVEAEAFVMIGGLVVDRGYRKQGIGRRLLERAEQWAVTNECSVVRLSTNVKRTEAHQFYQRVGYVNLKTQYSFAKPIGAASGDTLRAFVPDVT